MLVHYGLASMQAEWPGAVVCIGTFDGVHLGHRAVISQAVDLAEERRLPAVLVTFDRHPLAIIRPEAVPQAVANLDQNVRQFEELGIAVTVVLPFDEELRETAAEHFFARVLRQALRAEHVVVGHDFAFGKGREGTASWLSERLPTTVVDALERNGRRVSSSEIRRAVANGDVAEAALLLGRPFELSGIVVRGQRLGRELGYPTANLARSGNTVVPANGIYAGEATTRFGRYRAAISVGVRPTVSEQGARTIEAHLIDYPGTGLYGQHVRLTFERRLRDEQRFDSVEALKEQMAADVASAARPGG
ncbi:MAG: bifunctional riboflavin kinase/FAD synthetase [Fimbriimonadaceae bacterium]